MGRNHNRKLAADLGTTPAPETTPAKVISLTEAKAMMDKAKAALAEAKTAEAKAIEEAKALVEPTLALLRETLATLEDLAPGTYTVLVADDGTATVETETAKVATTAKTPLPKYGSDDLAQGPKAKAYRAAYEERYSAKEIAKHFGCKGDSGVRQAVGVGADWSKNTRTY